MTNILESTKKLFGRTARTRSIAVASAFACLIAVATLASAAQLKEARVSQVVNDVKLLLQQAAPRPAVVSDLVRYGTAVRTGTQSRSELTFADLTITRLGANTIFSFNQGTREMNLIDGAILFQVPKGKGGATIKTAAVTVSITGTTGIGEFHPATAGNPQPFSKWLCLEGSFRLILPNGQSVEVGPGKMVTTDGKSFSKVSVFAIDQVMKTSLLVIGYDTPLPSNVLDLIALEEQKQLDLKIASDLVDTTTTNPLDPTRIVNVINQGIVAEEAQASPSPSVSPTPPPPTPTPPPPTPTPSKVGTPSVITSPVPYVITSGTTISTDPAITTNGVTNFGTIYRGPTDDGAFSVWAFGSTSAVDTALDFDTHFNAAGHFPAAAFKFTSLVLAGNPTIDLSNGGVANLALISVGDITSGLPGGTLTFSGLDALLLASQDGSINLGSEITFQDIPTLFFYARGTNGDLTLASPISGTTDLFLYAGRNITLNAGTDLTLGGQLSIQTVGGNISVSEDGDITVGESFSAMVKNNGGEIGTGGNISVTTGGDLITSGDATFTIQNTAGTIDNGGNITLLVDSSVSTQGQLSLLVENYDFTANPAGHIGNGGNISLATGGNLNADSMSVAINNRGGGVIDSGASLVLNIGGALTTLHDGLDFIGNPNSLSLAISSRYDDQAGNTDGSFIGGDASLLFHSDSASIGGHSSVIISDRGGIIDGNALLNFSVTHDITVQSDATWQILNDSGTDLNAASPIGGTIHGNAILLLSAANLNLTAGSLDVSILNKNGGVIGSGGTIDSDANLTLTLSGNLTSQGSAFFGILNQLQPGGTTGGTIGGDATINVTAANISTGLNSFGSSLDDLINNATGNIGGDAIVNVDVTDVITAQGPADFQILNNDGGHIGGNANILVTTGGDLTANSVLAFVNNHNGGSIDSGANISFNIGGALTTTGDATFGISNLNDGTGGGTIGSLATVDLNAASISVGGFFQTFVSANGGGSIQGDAINTVDVTGDVTAQQGILLDIADTIFGSTGNFTGGRIDGDAIVTVNAQNISTPSTNSGIPGTDLMAIEASIYPNASGTVGGAAIVNVLASQDISAPGSVLFWIANGNYLDLGGGTIGGDATVNVSASNISTGDLFTQILNYGGASIGADAAINITADTLSVGGNLDSRIDNSSSGIIGGNATINMNVSGNTTVTNDATFQILGSDGAAAAAINFNGSSYDAGGTFLAFIDGNGTITFNNASAHADVLKAGVFGTNGVLNIGGGTLSADTTLELYAPGSNGQLNFISNVTLGGNGAKILAANSVTIFNNIVVTIGGPNPADVYANSANYTGFGGNNSTTGTFADAGANDPQPLANAPPFGPSSPATVPTGGTTTRERRTGSTINISSSDQLLSLLDGAERGPGGKITIPASKSTSNWKNSGRTNATGRLNAAGRLNAGRRALDIRTASSLSVRGQPQ